MKAAGQRFDAEVVAGDGTAFLLGAWASCAGLLSASNFKDARVRPTAVPPLMSWTLSSAPQLRPRSRGGTWQINPFGARPGYTGALKYIHD